MEKVLLDLGEQSYQIKIGSGLLANPKLVMEHIQGEQIFIVSNQTVAELYLDKVSEGLKHYQVDVYCIPDGEQYKTLATVESIIGELLRLGHKRSTTILALGGGVVGDTAGFVAASYQRGVGFVQIPTTLLSQVDSSVGGKTAVNHSLGKNMIGSFYQPKVVLIDTDTLASLPALELSAGLAEVIKHGILADCAYFNFVEANIDGLRSIDRDLMTQVIRGSCQIKASIVAEDERESGRRALLNLGHTFGHAIEAALGYGEWLHGEAVGVGLVMAADLSARMGRCTNAEARRIKGVVDAAGLPTAPPKLLSSKDFLSLMSKDKKATDKGLRFVLLAGKIGSTEVVEDVPISALQETLNAGDRLCE
ncbi:MAG TPA: 3-dehydroquinate synthase [Gammaproteobacteria bacterium]|nr:3-dehydroquinate synthase [Gammaproteobacteria bacterium]